MTRASSLPALLAAVCLAAPGALAAGETKPPIHIENAWLRATPKGAPVIGGYATITNDGSAPDRLVGARIAVAAPAEVHSMTMTNGVMRMRQLDEGLSIASGATVTLTPGGYHLMFPKPTAQVKEGASLQGTLLFEKAGAVPVTFAVGGMAAKSAPGNTIMKDMSGSDMTH